MKKATLNKKAVLLDIVKFFPMVKIAAKEKFSIGFFWLPMLVGLAGFGMFSVASIFLGWGLLGFSIPFGVAWYILWAYNSYTGELGKREFQRLNPNYSENPVPLNEQEQ